jgi:Fe-S-cluster containining protein
MIETFYVHFRFLGKDGVWSINLPFNCSKCGNCCTLDDFLTAGPIHAKSKEHPDIEAKIEALYDKLECLLDLGEEKYDDYIMHNPCLFLKNKVCSIYPIRPEGCRQFPNTRFGINSEGCESLTRFHKQRTYLKKGRINNQTYHFTTNEIKPVKYSGVQYESCIVKLKKAGATSEELELFTKINEKH